jgi:tRNA A-37 threonylcarbamoyl transferase component Bud32/CheY-like chemotaxis protein
MPEIDIDMLVDQLTLIGLVSRDQYLEARTEAEDGSGEALIRVLMRKGWLTSWQLERLKKGDPSSFFFGLYRALFHLAEGTFARVYRGQHSDAGTPVAIKVLRNRFASISEAVHRFHKEAEAGMRLRHPNIVQVVDQGQQENRHFMIMEYVEGMNLREFLKLRVRLRDKEALPLLIGLAQGLEYSHEQGVTHRDLKATNVLISNSGTAKLVDFGLATMEGDERHGIHSQRTVDYSALERTCLSPKGDPRSDIYFLGCVFYHMLTGQVPLEDSESKDPLKKMLKRGFNTIKPLSEHRHAPDERLAHIIERMMKLDLKARYQSMTAVVTDLEDYQVTVDPAAAEARAHALKYGPQANEEIEEEEQSGELVFLAPEEVIQAHEGAEDSPPAESEVKAPAAKNVLCVESQAEIQDALRKNLTRMGYRVLLVGDAERAAERYREAPTDAVIFDVDGLGPEAMTALQDMHEKAEEDGHPLAALVLLGPRQESLKEKLPAGDRLIVLTKPIKLKQVQDAIAELLPVG